MSTFTLSIETDAGSYQYGFHLGTIERVAADCAENIFRNHTPKIGNHIVSVALFQIRDGRNKMIDCYDGRWSSDWDDHDYAIL